MPEYSFWCDCGNTDTVWKATTAQFPRSHFCQTCGREMNRDFSESRSFSFQPYEEDGFTGEPIKVATPKQRDDLIKKHGCTYDSVKYSLHTMREKREKTAAEDLCFNRWAKEMKDHGHL